MKMFCFYICIFLCNKIKYNVVINSHGQYKCENYCKNDIFFFVFCASPVTCRIDMCHLFDIAFVC